MIHHPNLDPITFEVIKNALGAVADEMALVVMRSAYSAVVRDSMDYSTAVADRDGQIVAQGLTLAVQLGSFPDCLALLVGGHRATTVPGDVYLFNDPYGSAGQHLPDLYVIKPLFAERELVGWVCTMAHHCDIGGIAPGSTAMHATDILQEGLCIPILKLYEAGRPNHTLFEIIRKNSRQPRYVLGDLRAQLAACAVGERGYLELVRRHGPVSLGVYFEAMQAQAERMMRGIIRAIPDGVYHFTDYIDGVGEAPRPIAIKTAVSVRDEAIHIDFAGSSPQVPAAINCPIAMVRSAAYCAIRCLSEAEIPNCQGYMRPVRIDAPEGTIVNPRFPAACAARGVIGYRVFDAIMGALAQAVPERVIAAGEGGPTLFSIGGGQGEESFVLTEVMVGTWGARATQDGIEGISNPAANLSNQPVELIETEMPLEVVRYGLEPDSGGPGRFRGGLAFVREFRLLGEDADCTLRSDRRTHRPYGIAGGQPGGPSANFLRTADGVEQPLPTMPMTTQKLRRGDTFRHLSAGGGGYGNPLERDPAAVLEDVIDEKVSLAAAAHDYGVVIDAVRRRIDGPATTALRHRRAASLRAAS
jgi:N-methylhydantoinase B